MPTASSPSQGPASGAGHTDRDPDSCREGSEGVSMQHRGPQEPEDGRPHIQVLLAERQPLNAEPKTHRGARGAGALSGAEPGKCLA